jgi:alpha-1,4-glucan:maltose-1-phosphate maltosyltransferase-like protein
MGGWPEVLCDLLLTGIASKAANDHFPQSKVTGGSLRQMPQQAADGRRRVVIEQVSPEIDCGRFAIKRVIGETVVVEADVFADGHFKSYAKFCTRMIARIFNRHR